jgi:hypothetical protein
MDVIDQMLVKPIEKGGNMLTKLTKSHSAKKRDFRERTAAATCATMCFSFCDSGATDRYSAYMNLYEKFEG